MNKNKKIRLHAKPLIVVKHETEIYIMKSKINDTIGFCWAWKESFDKNVFGFSLCVDDIYKRANKMFPNTSIILKFL
jgi:hypothetical protein